MTSVSLILFALGCSNVAAIDIDHWEPPPLNFDTITSTCEIDRGDSCLFGNYYYSNNPLEPSRSTQLGTMNVGDSVYVSFDLVLNSNSGSGWKNIIHIGSSNTERSPSIFLHPNQNKLHIRMSDTDGFNTGYDPDDLLTVNTVYNVKLTVIDGIVTSYIDDVEKISRSDITVLQRVDAPIYVSSPDYAAADVTISNLIIQPCGCFLSSTSYSMTSSLTSIRDTQIGSIDVGDSLDLSFDMVLHSGPTGSWRSVLHIGSANFVRLPGIFLKPNSNQFEFAMSDQDNNNRLYNFADILTLNTIYNIRLTIIDGTVTTYLNGVAKNSRSNINTILQTNAPIYVSDPWYDAADVTISNLNIGPYVPPPTKSPSPSPTPAPTDVPTPSPTDFPTRSPTAFPTLSPSVEPSVSPTQAPNDTYSSYGASFTVSDFSLVGHVDIGDSLYLSFDLMLNSLSSGGIKSILSVGDEPGNASPEILLISNNMLFIRVAGDDDDIYKSLSADTVYNVKFLVLDGIGTAYLDNIVEGRGTGSDVALFQRKNTPIFVTNPNSFYSPADAIVSNLIVRPHGGQIETSNMICAEFEACSYSEMTLTVTTVGEGITFGGAYSGKGSLIYAPEGGYFHTIGHGAAKDATIFCGNGETCQLICSSACNTVNLKCIDNGNSCVWKRWSSTATGTTDTWIDLSLPAEYQIPNLDDLDRRLSEDDEAAFEDSELTSVVLTGVAGSIYCLAVDSCRLGFHRNINGDAFLGNQGAGANAVIDGVNGNVYADAYLVARHCVILNVAGNVVFRGQQAGRYAYIENVGGSLVVYGSEVLLDAEITGVNKIDAKGYNQVLSGATITTDLEPQSIFVLNIEVFAEDDDSYHLTCSENNICYINCLSANSCTNAKFVCQGASCYVYCPYNCPLNENVDGYMIVVESLLTESSDPGTCQIIGS